MAIPAEEEHRTIAVARPVGCDTPLWQTVAPTTTAATTIMISSIID
jgi:hypothetical protein